MLVDVEGHVAVLDLLEHVPAEQVAEGRVRARVIADPGLEDLQRALGRVSLEALHEADPEAVVTILQKAAEILGEAFDPRLEAGIAVGHHHGVEPLVLLVVLGFLAAEPVHGLPQHRVRHAIEHPPQRLDDERFQQRDVEPQAREVVGHRGVVGHVDRVELLGLGHLEGEAPDGNGMHGGAR